MDLGLDRQGIGNLFHHREILSTYTHATETHRKLVKFPKALQTRIVRALQRSRRIRIPRRKPIRDRTPQHVLTELLHLVMHDVLEPLPRRENTSRSAERAQERLGARGLHLEADVDAIDCGVRFVVDGEAAGECFAELDGTECGGEGEEFGDVCEVA